MNIAFSIAFSWPYRSASHLESNLMLSTIVFLDPYLDLDEKYLVLYGSFDFIYGKDTLMPDTSKYRSIAVPLDTYNKLSKICQEEHRGMGKQMTKFVDDHFKKIFKD